MSWEPDQEESTPGILDCYLTREYELMWGPGGFSLWSEDYYFSWSDPDYTAFDFFSFATDGVIGEWYFQRVAGNIIL